MKKFDELELRSRKALLNITKNEERKQRELGTLVSNIFQEEMIDFFKDVTNEPFSYRKRIIQEQCAHFILRFLTLNNKTLRNGQGPIKVMGLAGPEPLLAIASYMRRGLVTIADLFEKDKEIYQLWIRSKVNTAEFQVALNNSALNNTLWKDGKENKVINVFNRDYLDDKNSTKYRGFLLDHCGAMPDAEILSRYIKRKTNDGVFFVEATMPAGRVINPALWSAQFEDSLYNKNIFMLAKDSYEYKGGKDNGHGFPMKTFVWVFEKNSEEIIVN